MIWSLSHRFDPKAVAVADRHYNRQKPGTPQCAPPGRCMVLYASERGGQAFWITSWPFAEYVKHAWAGAWVCSAFRNEGCGVASEMIREAVAATLAFYGAAPPLGMITFVDRKKVRPYVTPKGHKIFGQVYRQAGFKEVGETKGGLLALQLLPNAMPAPRGAHGMQANLFGVAA